MVLNVKALKCPVFIIFRTTPQVSIELTTSCSSNRRYYQLSYWGIIICDQIAVIFTIEDEIINVLLNNRGERGIRTLDGKPVLP